MLNSLDGLGEWKRQQLYVGTDEFFNSFSPGWLKISGYIDFKKVIKKGGDGFGMNPTILFWCLFLNIYNREEEGGGGVIKHSQAQTHKFCSWCCPKKEIPFGVVERFTPCDMLSRYIRVLLLLLETDRDTYMHARKGVAQELSSSSSSSGLVKKEDIAPIGMRALFSSAVAATAAALGR